MFGRVFGGIKGDIKIGAVNWTPHGRFFHPLEIEINLEKFEIVRN